MLTILIFGQEFKMVVIITELGMVSYDRDTLVVSGSIQPIPGATKILSIHRTKEETVISYDNGIKVEPEGKVLPPNNIVVAADIGLLVMLGIAPLTLYVGDHVYPYDLDLTGYHPCHNIGFELDKTMILKYTFISSNMKKGIKLCFDAPTKTFSHQEFSTNSRKKNKSYVCWKYIYMWLGWYIISIHWVQS